MKIVIVGSGWAGCSAAISARNMGAEVTLLERTDMLLGTGLVGGIMKNNGRLTATLESKALGAGDLFEACERVARHSNIEFPGHKHADLYDVALIHEEVKHVLEELGVKIVFKARINGAKVENGIIESITDAAGNIYEGDVFIDTTGTAGPMNNCNKYGNGCAMCMLRCPSFGGRVSLTGLCGVDEKVGAQKDGSVGAMSGSCKLNKDSLSPEVKRVLEESGVAIIPIPENSGKTSIEKKACQQYALQAFKENIILLDTGHAKLMSPYYDLAELKKIPGLENARYEDPYAGGIGNSMRYFGMAPRNNALQVEGVHNLFCAGEKAGLLVGHTEAIVTGALAGYNAVMFAEENELLVLPDELAIGDAISFVNEQMETEEGLTKKYTFSGSVYFERMKEKGLYIEEAARINEKVEGLGLTNVFKIRK